MRIRKVAVCPNCNGRNTSLWPFGPCTVCKGRGKTTMGRRAEVLANRTAAQRALDRSVVERGDL